ncbi:hypothetical protein EVAR_23727_1 [Eumeta japonica]|uniref:Uncharacterized protein n=1 Tax=Eumeta variegata TaxID=151549 RepID=A0A4C1VEY6_EUMVA|nr:hypothetical protein EVAR_23727_1 [Eumeta japonica]
MLPRHTLLQSFCRLAIANDSRRHRYDIVRDLWLKVHFEPAVGRLPVLCRPTVMSVLYAGRTSEYGTPNGIVAPISLCYVLSVLMYYLSFKLAHCGQVFADIAVPMSEMEGLARVHSAHPVLRSFQ